MFNKAVLLFLIPVSLHSMDAEVTHFFVPQTVYNHGRDGLTMPRQGTVYQAHTFYTERVGDESDDDEFVGIVSKAEQRRRAEKVRQEKEKRDAAALDLIEKRRQQEQNDTSFLGGLFVEGDGHSSGDEFVYPNDCAPIGIRVARRSPTQFELEIDREVAEIYKQVTAFFASMWSCES